MLDLTQSLANTDLGFLRIVADFWGVDLHFDEDVADHHDHALKRIVDSLLDQGLISEVVEALPPEARLALEELLANDGKFPMQAFDRKHGPLREMGAGRRDRERAYLNPVSPLEILWYRAIVFSAFQDTPSGPQEFAYIPTDLLKRMPSSFDRPAAQLGHPATPSEREHVIPADDRILDHACTLLSALRIGLTFDSAEFAAGSWSEFNSYAPTPAQVQSLLVAAEIMDMESGLPHPEVTKEFLELPRASALLLLFNAWAQGTSFNDLHQLPGVIPEGGWQNDPLAARRSILGFLDLVPAGKWWSLSAFINAIKTAHPDFQRPVGNYDTWYLRDLSTGEFLRGFKNWDRVEGALIRFIITGPLHWLGALDLAAPVEGAPSTAFRKSRWHRNLLEGNVPEGLPKEEAKLLVSSNTRIRAPRLLPRTVRYQLARFCIWHRADQAAYDFLITPVSLRRAREQGLKISHLLSLLNHHAKAVPPSLSRALTRWEERESEARIEKVSVLRLRSPDMMKALRDSRAARFLAEPLGPTAITIKSGAEQKVLEVLAELGYLAEWDVESEVDDLKQILI